LIGLAIVANTGSDCVMPFSSCSFSKKITIFCFARTFD
jgi:hypothetical protein